MKCKPPRYDQVYYEGVAMLDEIEKGDGMQRDDKSELMLKTIQLAYRKHCLCDDKVGWVELEEVLLNTLCQVMGDEQFQEWLREVNLGGQNEKISMLMSHSLVNKCSGE